MIAALFSLMFLFSTATVVERLSDDIKKERLDAKNQRALFQHMDKLSNVNNGLSVHELYHGADVHGPWLDPDGYQLQKK